MRTKTLLLGCLSLFATTALACSSAEPVEDAQGGEDAINIRRRDLH